MGSIRAHGMLPEIAIVSDDTGQFAVGRHALCWVHAEPLAHKLDTFTKLHRAAQKNARALTSPLYDYLKEYYADLTARRRGELRARIDHIFRRCTGIVAGKSDFIPAGDGTCYSETISTYTTDFDAVRQISENCIVSVVAVFRRDF
jgi:hypothetical protein